MNLPIPALLTAVSLLSLSAAALAACDAAGDVRQICGVQSPEDLEVLPGGSQILISEMAGEKNLPGKFAVLDVATAVVTEIEPQPADDPDWGDPSCRQRAPAALSPHGIYSSRLADGRLQLLAINHGDAESVHAYVLTNAGGTWQLKWRGCVETAYNFNDLAATPDGFIGAHQYDKDRGEGPGAEKFLFSGRNTGFAVRWSQSLGFRRIPGTEAAFPNGMTVSPDGKTAWMVATAGRTVHKIDLVRNIQVSSADLPVAPDNLSWTADGQLLVTGAIDVQQLVRCANHGQSCPVAFAVARMEPYSLKSRVIFRNDGRLILGASVAVIAQKHIYIGSFTGDHLLQAPAPQWLPAL